MCEGKTKKEKKTGGGGGGGGGREEERKRHIQRERECVEYIDLLN